MADRFDTDKVNSVELHPIIFCIQKGNGLQQFVVAFHQSLYNCRRLSDAVDVSFKIYSVLHIDYPKESRQFYVFLNKMFYDINLNMRKSAKVLILSNKIKNIISKKD